jgi:hypothetical protein
MVELLEGIPQSAQIVGSDPRFAAQFRQLGCASIGELRAQRRSRDALEGLRQQVERLSGLSLGAAVEAYVASLFGGEPEQARLDAFIGRLGLRGSRPLTLEETGTALGVTRERARQVEGKIRKRHDSNLASPVFLPQLDDVLDEVEPRLPLGAGEPLPSSRAIDSTGDPLTGKTLERMLRFFRRPDRIRIVDVGDVGLVVRHESDRRLEALGRVPSIARRQSQKYGASNVFEVVGEVEDTTGVVIPPDLALGVVVAASRTKDGGNLLLEEDGWFAFSGNSRNRALITARIMLAASQSPLTIKQIRDGLRKRLLFRSLLVLPTSQILGQLLGADSAFHVMEDGRVASRVELDAEQVLGSEKHRMIEILREAPSRMMTRNELLEACERRGVNLSTAQVFLTYGEVFQRVDVNVWAVVGEELGPTEIAAFQQLRGMTPKTPLRRSHGWTQDGDLWFATEISKAMLYSGIVSVPAAIRDFLRGRDFHAISSGGSILGKITFDDDSSASWGWRSFFSKSGLEAGDFLRAAFRLADSQVVVQVAGPELLDDIDL